MGIAIPMGWPRFVILCACGVGTCMSVGTCGNQPPCTRQVFQAIFTLLVTNQKAEGEKCIRNSSVLMAQLSTERECSGCCWSCRSSASPAPAPGVALGTCSSLPVPASPAAPCPVPDPRVGQEQLPCQRYSLGMAQATLTPSVVNKGNDFGFVL